MTHYRIKPVYKRFFWPHPYARQARLLWVKLVVEYRHFIDGKPVPFPMPACRHADHTTPHWSEDGWVARCNDCDAIGYFGDGDTVEAHAFTWCLGGYAIGGWVKPKLRLTPFDRLPEFVMSRQANFILSSGNKDYLKPDAAKRRWRPLP